MRPKASSASPPPPPPTTPFVTDPDDRSDTFYAAADVVNGYGAELLVSDGGTTPVYEAIAFLSEITPGAMTTADIDRTHLRSPDAHHEHGPGLRDSGAFACKGKWVPTERSLSNAGGGSGPFADGGLVAMWRARKVYDFQIRLNDAEVTADKTLWPFTGYVSQFQPGAINATTDIDFSASFMPTKAYDAALP